MDRRTAGLTEQTKTIYPFGTLCAGGIITLKVPFKTVVGSIPIIFFNIIFLNKLDLTLHVNHLLGSQTHEMPILFFFFFFSEK